MLKTRDGPWKIQTFGGFVFEANSWCQSRKDCRNTKHSPQLFEIPEFVRIRRVCGVFWDGVDSSFSYTSKVTKQKRVYRYWRCLPGRKAIFLIDAFRTFASSVSGCIGFALFLHARKRIFIPGANQLIEFTNYKKHQETTNQCFIMFPPMCYAVWVCVSCRLTGAEVEAEFERLLAKAMCSRIKTGKVGIHDDTHIRLRDMHFQTKKLNAWSNMSLNALDLGLFWQFDTVWSAIAVPFGYAHSLSKVRASWNHRKKPRVSDAHLKPGHEGFCLEKRAFGCKRRFEICWFADLLYFHPFHLQ